MTNSYLVVLNRQREAETEPKRTIERVPNGKQTLLLLSEDDRKFLRKFGNGNMSIGIRKAIKLAREA